MRSLSRAAPSLFLSPLKFSVASHVNPSSLYSYHRLSYRVPLNGCSAGFVEARYSEHFEITVEELAWLEERIAALQEVVEVICRERLGV